MKKKLTNSSGNVNVRSTTNYKLFQRSELNRDTTMRGRKKLVASMKKNGWYRSKPLSAWRDPETKKLIVMDGQHRLLIAESLGIPVRFVVEPKSFSTAEINNTGKNWKLKDFADLFVRQGLSAYQEGLEFAETYKLPLGAAFALLAGYSSFSNVEIGFKNGKFKVEDKDWAEKVASLRSQMVALSPSLNKQKFTEACIAVCRVPEFDSTRLIRGAERRRDLLVSFSNRDAYLQTMEEVYNFGRKTLFGLKSAALMAMKKRSPIKEGKKSE